MEGDKGKNGIKGRKEYREVRNEDTKYIAFPERISRSMPQKDSSR
jgi:hypothetical protein